LRTLIISDLHLGSRLGRDVLRHPEALALLLGALDGIDRLVLLGDVVELAEGRPRQAMRAAEPVLRAIGTRLGPDREVVVVPGNHDIQLVRAWSRAQGEALTVDAAVPLGATALLAQLTSWLAPAPVRVHTPGVWLADRVWATHGHYQDRHLLPDSAYGITRGLLGGRQATDRAKPIDYERAGVPSITRIESALMRWLPRPLATLADDLTEALRAATMLSLPRRLQSHRLAPLTRLLLGAQMQRASIPALAHVVRRLGVDADWVIYGHVHRSGPRAGDDAELWRGPGGGPRIANTGSWVYEPLLMHRAAPPQPYWPGGAVLLEDGAVPQAISLLDDLDLEGLHHRRPPR
jgi:UDP-2,3-diacylglucosamine pyrophosphatase LpxH